jgi:hypothetical protein
MTVTNDNPAAEATMSDTSAPARSHTPHRIGAPLIPPAIAYATLTVLAVLAPLVATSGHPPWGSDADLISYFAHHQDAARAQAFFTVGAAVPFAVVVAVTVSRLRTLGFEVPGRMIALAGGTVATAALAMSGLVTLALVQPSSLPAADVVRVFQALATALGGQGFVVFEGLFVAGVSVIGLLGGALPKILSWFGIVVAVVSELASLSIAFAGLAFLLPIGRFGSLAFILVMAFLLPASRRDARFRG